MCPDGVPLYDRIGGGYDQSRRADPYLATRMAHLLRLRGDAHYLDLACGTGNYTQSLAARLGRWVGLDLSETMVQQARAKSKQIAWLLGRAEKLPVANASFDGVLCSLALHQLSDLRLCCDEVRRVLRGGLFVMFTSTPAQMRRYWLNAYFPVAMARSIDQMPTLDALETACRTAGFCRIDQEPYFVQRDLQDGFLYHGRYRPEVYLTDEGRAGISTFRHLADDEEIRDGCERLADDLRSDRFRDVAARYESDLGDYMFVTAMA